MDYIETNYDFNVPIELTEVFRIPAPSGGMIEYAAKVLVGWEDLRMIEEYAYPDDWQAYAGPKYWVTLSGANNPKLIFGDYTSIKAHWTMMRKKYPPFFLAINNRDGMD